MSRGKSRDARDGAWRTVAARQKGELVEAKDSLRRVRFPHEAWAILLDQDTVSNGSSSTTYTRLRTLVNAKTDFRFGFYRESFITRVGRMLGVRDVITGNPLLDRDYLVRTNDEAMIRALVAGSHISELLAQQPSGKLELARFRGRWGNRPRDVAELRWYTEGVITEPHQLELLVRTFRETLTRLTRIGAVDATQVDYEL